MQTEESKRFVLEFMKELSDGNTPWLVDKLADDATWTVVGDSALWPMAGTKNKAQQQAAWEGLEEAIPGGIQIIVTGVTAEGNRVAVEATSYAEVPNGNIYNNQYHFLFELDNGKIKAVREYCDTLFAKTTL